ncbi:M15 family metallopeptidase [Candidatus Kaiserbacteria bacterium]|nr:MAG: M15 family metallopeptidase [Candidatus Kaiserbacteria bacterium]
MKKHKIHILIGIIGLCTVALIVSTYGFYSVKQENKAVSAELQHAKIQIDDLAAAIEKKDEEVEVHKELLRIVRQEATDSSYDLSRMLSLIESATQTVEDIKKLEEADAELLAKYSKVFFLNEHYEPAQLAYIPSELVYSDNNQQISSDVLPFLLSMTADMKSSGLQPQIISAFRSFGYQSNLKQNHTVTYGTTVANQFVADQGYSEHQLGTTIDMVNSTIGSDMLDFDTTPEYQWMLQNAHKYGFVLSYPENNAYYEFEPWHWRFVGKELAADLYNKGTTFYNTPQRDIDAYRLTMFEN